MMRSSTSSETNSINGGEANPCFGCGKAIEGRILTCPDRACGMVYCSECGVAEGQFRAWHSPWMCSNLLCAYAKPVDVNAATSDILRQNLQHWLATDSNVTWYQKSCTEMMRLALAGKSGRKNTYRVLMGWSNPHSASWLLRSRMSHIQEGVVRDVTRLFTQVVLQLNNIQVSNGDKANQIFTPTRSNDQITAIKTLLNDMITTPNNPLLHAKLLAWHKLLLKKGVPATDVGTSINALIAALITAEEGQQVAALPAALGIDSDAENTWSQKAFETLLNRVFDTDEKKASEGYGANLPHGAQRIVPRTWRGNILRIMIALGLITLFIVLLAAPLFPKYMAIPGPTPDPGPPWPPEPGPTPGPVLKHLSGWAGLVHDTGGIVGAALVVVFMVIGLILMSLKLTTDEFVPCYNRHSGYEEI